MNLLLTKAYGFGGEKEIMGQEIEDLELCPCRSRKKYKNCCKKKAFKFVRDKDNKIYKRMPILDDSDTPEYMKEAMDSMGISSRKDLWAKFLEINAEQIKNAQFIDFPYMPEDKFAPEMLDFIEVMKEANIAPELIFAYQRTGLIVTEHNKRFLPDVELQEFDDAIKEYLKKHKKKRD